MAVLSRSPVESPARGEDDAAAGHRETCRPLTIDGGPRPALRKSPRLTVVGRVRYDAPLFRRLSSGRWLQASDSSSSDLIAVERRFLGEEQGTDSCVAHMKESMIGPPLVPPASVVYASAAVTWIVPWKRNVSASLS